mmetsp:Transcript_47511/g.122760  ORF Transcript_47511/g.122760 Transcript_47511/m.122760 type:complete len:726 (-) Transcript_47511:126-2303(-)
MAGGIKVQKSAQSPVSPSNQNSSDVQQAPPAPKVVGPNVMGKREEYQLVRRLQSALFGGVYEAKGITSGREFAIKVLHKSELSKAQETNSIEFCEVPLSEIRFAELMSGDEHVMEPEEHFEDMYCFYIVFELARGGDLLEALKHKPHGFDELHAQYFIKQAAKGLAFLHRRKVAMQDVSLENCLLSVDESTGDFKVKVCDPGQAAIFDVDESGEELPVNFRGLVGKSFRPPELHEQKPYYSTKVDSWCLGWSTFYLLTAQPLFMSADPAQQDADWLLFQQGNYTTLFQQKTNLCSHTGLDFIFRLLQLEPSRRMSIQDALGHAWLADPKICPVIAPKVLWPESLLKAAKAKEAPAPKPKEKEQPSVNMGGTQRATGTLSPGVSADVSSAKLSGPSLPAWSAPGGSSELPTWPGANQSPHTPMARLRSPVRSPRSSVPMAGVVGPQHRVVADRRGRGRTMQMGPAGRQYVVATNHSPAPVGAMPTSPMHRGSPRAASPLQSPTDPSLRAGVLQPSMSHNDKDEAGRSRAWAFRPETGSKRMGSDGGEVTSEAPTTAGTRTASRAVSPVPSHTGPNMVPATRVLGGTMVMNPHVGSAAGRTGVSPTRTGAVYVNRSPSPVHLQPVVQGSPLPHAAMRTASPAGAMRTNGFSWSQAPTIFAPRQGTAVSRTASPMGAAPAPIGFAWSPDPPSPRLHQRTFSPGPIAAVKGAMPAARGLPMPMQPMHRP